MGTEIKSSKNKLFYFDFINSNGFSVFETMIALGLSSIVGFSVMSSFIDSKKQEIQTQKESSLELTHLQLSQKSRSYSFWQTLINNLPNSLAVKSCLSKQGTSCSSLASSDWVNAYYACADSTCETKTTLKYKLICQTATACKGLEIQAITNYVPVQRSPAVNTSPVDTHPTLRPLANKTKELSSFIDGKLLQSNINSAINNSCTTINGQGITDINADHTTFYCNSADTVQKCSTNSEPLQQIGSTMNTEVSATKCQIPVQKNCTNKGLSGSSVFKDMANCDVTPAEDTTNPVPAGAAVITQSPQATVTPIRPLAVYPEIL